MRRSEIAIGTVVVAALLAVAGFFVWPMLSALSASEGGLAPAIVMIVGCFVLGGALMFLLFFSARRGHDEAVYRGGRDPDDDSASSWRRRSPHHQHKR
ncbi:MAG TPA: hypothetical protein VGN80_11895 [Devosiaceae bacterium]|jgi:predicted phage tail protein|nr:hypothetical protein [Devosiaceae bacterium]